MKERGKKESQAQGPSGVYAMLVSSVVVQRSITRLFDLESGHMPRWRHSLPLSGRRTESSRILPLLCHAGRKTENAVHTPESTPVQSIRSNLTPR